MRAEIEHLLHQLNTLDRVSTIYEKKQQKDNEFTPVQPKSPKRSNPRTNQKRAQKSTQLEHANEDGNKEEQKAKDKETNQEEFEDDFEDDLFNITQNRKFEQE